MQRKLRQLVLPALLLVGLFAVPTYHILWFQSGLGQDGIPAQIMSVALVLAAAGYAVALAELAAHRVHQRWIAVLTTITLGPFAAYLLSVTYESIYASQFDMSTKIWSNTWSASLWARGRWLYAAVFVGTPLWFLFRVSGHRSTKSNDA